MKKVLREEKGTRFRFDMESNDLHWIWHEMIGQLDDESITKVCSAPLTRCEFSLRGDQKGPTGESVWDFRVHRVDGTMMTLHPDWSRPAFKGATFSQPAEGEAALQAMSTYGADSKKCKHFRKSLGDVKLRFDPNKKPPRML